MPTVLTLGTDGSATYGAVDNSGPLTHSVGGTNSANCVLMIDVAFTCTSTTPKPIQGVTDSQGNTWQLLTAQEAHAGWNTAQTLNGVQKSFSHEVWYTKGATVNASIDITIDHGSGNTIDKAAVIFSPKYTGCDSVHPFDQDASLPKVLRANSNTVETLTGINSSTADIFPVWCFGAWGTDLGVSNVTFNGVARTFQTAQQANGSEFVKAQMASGPATSTYSSVTFTSGSGTASASNYFLIGVLLTADAANTGPSGPLDVTEFPDNFFAFGGQPPHGTFNTTENADRWTSAQAFEAIAIDGAAVNGDNPTFSTSGPNRIIVMGFGNASVGTQVNQPVTGITSTSGLSFRKSDFFDAGQDTASSDNIVSELWWAYAPNKLTNEVITVTHASGTASTQLAVCFAIKGLNGNFGDPFDRINKFAHGAASGAMVSGTSQPQTFRHVATGPLSASGAASNFATFDASNLNHATLSNGNLTVTSDGTNDPHNWAAPINAAGKDQTTPYTYMEATFDHIAGTKYGFGVLHIESNWDVDGLIASGIGGIYCRGDGTIWAAGSLVGSLGVTPANGDVIGLLIRSDYALAWFKDITQGGFWNGDPHAVPGYATDSYGGGGLRMATFEIALDPSGLYNAYLLGGAILPYCSPGGIAGSPHGSITANFGATTFAVGTPPGGAEGWTYLTPAVAPTHVHYPSVVVGLQFNLTDGGGASTPGAPPGYTSLYHFDHQGSQRHGNLGLFVQVRNDNILTTDNDFMVAPTAVKQWSLLYTTFIGSPAVNYWASLEEPDRMVFFGHQAAGVRGDLTSTEARDIFAATGFTADVGTFNTLEAPDIFSAFGFQPLSGTFNVTEAPDRFHATGIGQGEDGVLITTEAPDVFAAIGTVPIAGTWISTEAADTMRFIGAGVTQVRRRRHRFVT